MTVGQLFTRQHDGGWLVLTAGLPSFGGAYPDLAAHLLERIDLTRTVTCICASSVDLKDARRFADELEGLLDRECPVGLLGGTAGVAADHALAVLCGGSAAAWTEALSAEAPAARSLAAVAEDGLLLAAGSAAAAIGTWVTLPREGGWVDGAGWLIDAIVLPAVDDPGKVAGVAERLSGSSRQYAIGLAEGSVLALGPRGEVELWGSARPTILLGGGWRQI